MPPRTGTEEKLRGMGCTMDQRKRLMSAAKFGLGPLKELGLAQEVARASKEAGGLAPEASRASKDGSAVALIGTPMGSAAPPPLKPDEDDQDLDAFLAGGREMAVKAAKAAQAAKERQLQTQAIIVAAADRERQQQAVAAAAAKVEEERQEEERQASEREHRRKEEEDAKLEEERRREERRKVRQEEKRRRREEKARQRKQARREAGLPEDEVEDDSSDETQRRKRKSVPLAAGGVFKDVFRGDGSKRMHWGESVKGRVSNDYKGFTDADLDRRFSLSEHQPAQEKLMTEEEVLALLRRGRAK